MKRFFNIAIAVLLAAVVALGMFQGARVRHLRDSELFYRWILSHATQSRIFSEDFEKPLEPGEKKLMDRELFASVADALDSAFDDVLITDDDVDSQGKPLKRLVVAVRDGAHDDRLWALVRGDSLAEQRRNFFNYLRDDRLMSVASRFDPQAVYGSQGAAISLSNIFLGFRQLAANFVWLQVDKYWHQGYMQRMIPLMNTCVALDPTFVDAYLLGAWHLAYNITAKMPATPEPLKKYNPKYGVRMGEKEHYYYMAVDFLKDGIWKNPRNYKLNFDLGFAIYNLKLNDYKDAVIHLREADRYRPADAYWVPRQLYICMELDGQYKEARAGWEKLLVEYPDSELIQRIAPRFIKRNDGMILEKKAEQAEAQAQAAENPSEAEALQGQADEYWAEARKVWGTITDGSGELDPFSEGRILRLAAIELIQEERYHEAIAVLDNARWKSSHFFDEATQMILDVKLKANIPLSASEKKAVIREKEAEKYLLKEAGQTKEDEANRS